MSALILRGDAAHLPLPDESVDLIVTSPPYFGLRSYTDTCNVCLAAMRDGIDPRTAFVNPSYDEHVRKHHHYAGQIGSEATPREFIDALLACTREWVRVLKPSGSMFVNLGDKYSTGSSGQSALAEWSAANARGGAHTHGPAKPGRRRPVEGMPPKTLLGMPWRYALGCVDDLGLILRAEIVWAKPNGLPESVTDRVRRAHEQVFHFTKQPRYYSAVDEVREPHAYPKDVRGESWRRQAQGATDHHSRSDPNPLGKLPGSVWEIPSQPLTVPAHLGVDHFAAFPMELPRRIILGWSPSGICTECGEGRRPVAVAEFDRQGRSTNGPQSLARRHESPGREVRAIRSTTITGYACACPQPGAPTRPAVVVDPFGGTGTTALVAAVHGRTGVSVDRSADYCRLARWRVSDPAERARAMQVPKPPPVPEGQAALFDGLEAFG